MWSARGGTPRTNDIDIDERRKTITGHAEGKETPPGLDKHRGIRLPHGAPEDPGQHISQPPGPRVRGERLRGKDRARRPSGPVPFTPLPSPALSIMRAAAARRRDAATMSG
jgi:hypothetical protein